MGHSVTTHPPDAPSPVTRIVGIGASAGGLVALEQLLSQISPTSGLAYIVVQHLDPTHKALLVDLLQRVTTMLVRQAEEMMRVEPDCVYVIPPNNELSVVNGVLNLKRPAEPRGMRLPINVLFSSLARGQGERAIGVILSGMGSDGTLGLKEIAAAGGLTVAQQPESAQFDSMPNSAIATGSVNMIAEPAEMAALILAYVAQQPALSEATPAGDRDAEPSSAAPMQQILRTLRQQTKHDFSLYKFSTVHRRIERRMVVHSIDTMGRYADFLQQNPQEVGLLFKELLIGVTRFFRDVPMWQHLADVALPELLAQRPNEHQLRAWVVGCSTGEEAYSLAIVFTEVVQRSPQYRGRKMQIFASDLSADAITVARRGQYSDSICADVSTERLDRFFTRNNGSYRIDKAIRDMVLFGEQDVVLDPPFTRLDLLSCRNLMIYFDAELQRRLLPLFYYSVRPGGMLLLGSSETVGHFSRLFAPIDAKLRIYRRQDSSAVAMPEFLLNSLPPLSVTNKDLPVPPPATPPHSPKNLQEAADHLLLQVYAPAAVVINNVGDIIYISGRTGKYLEPAAGKANWNLHAMAREGLRACLADALKQAATQNDPVQLRGLRVKTEASVQIVDVTVQAITKSGVLAGTSMIVFRDVATAPARRGRNKKQNAVEASHTADLQQLQDEIQSLHEAARASQEELQSANEELQSMNEELQSANEELTTSKEEMQSMNEELQTVNAEMQAKLDDLALAQSDMKNLLNSTDIAMLFLDQELNVRRFTDRASKIISLRESDIGRPLTDLTTTLHYPTLKEDASKTLRTLVFSEKQIRSNDDRWFSVRIMPYRRLDNVVDGAVITLVDITAAKKLESKLRQEADS